VLLLLLLLLPLAVGARGEEAERVFMFVDPLVVDEYTKSSFHGPDFARLWPCRNRPGRA
jgi:hypothetical protein